jgi:glycosyltransferase involved in cell wall biosynthesis
MSILTRITIITPSFNQAPYLEQTIDSILSQGYPNLEYIIMDGGSNDGSVDIIKKYERHLTHWESKPDNGQAHAINKGLKIATGEVINWINSDDLLEENALHRIAEIFSHNKNTLCVVGNYYNLIQNNKETISTPALKDDFYQTVKYPVVKQPATFYHKNALNTLGPLNENLHYTMDLDWFVKYLCHFGLNGYY